MKNICSVCGKVFEEEENEFNSFVDDLAPVCDECKIVANKKLLMKKLNKKLIRNKK